MITRFTTYINESRKSIDYLETLTPDHLGWLLIDEVQEDSPDIRYIENLIAVGCPIDFRGAYDWTPLQHAAQNGYLDVVKLLVSKGAGVNKKNKFTWNALQYAAQVGDIEIVKTLLSNGAQIDDVNSNNMTALYIAARDGKLDIVEFLLSKGANIYIKHKVDGGTAWDIATNEIRQCIPELNPNFVKHITESRKSIDELEMLNPWELGKLLHGEVRRDITDIQFIQDLLTVGCPIEARDDNNDMTPLHYAAWLGHLEMLEFLVSKGAELEARDNKGWTPLHYAAGWGRLEIVEFLISGGGDMHARTNSGRRVWDIASNKTKMAFPELNPDK